MVFYRFGLGEIGWGLVPVIGVLLLCGWCTAMLVIGLLLRYGQSAEILAWATTFVLLALSGVFNPVESLPGRDPTDRQGPAHHLRLPRRARPARRRADPVERPPAGHHQRVRAGGPVDALRAAHAADVPRPRLRHAVLLARCHGRRPAASPNNPSLAAPPPSRVVALVTLVRDDHGWLRGVRGRSGTRRGRRGRADAPPPPNRRRRRPPLRRRARRRSRSAATSSSTPGSGPPPTPARATTSRPCWRRSRPASPTPTWPSATSR